MTRNLKALGLALLSVCALGAVAASAATAATDHFTSPLASTIITGDQVGTTHVFGTKSSSLEVSCNKAHFAGTAEGTSALEIEVHPEYSECSAGVFGNATVDTTGCNYNLTGETDPYTNTSGVSEGEAATVGVACEGSTVKITGSGCTISIGSQEHLLGVKYDNEGSGSTADVKVTVKVDGIAYTSSGVSCGLVGIKASGTDGFLTEEVTAKGFEDNAGTEGSQVGISVD
jgi:hypothetical protein